MSGVPSQGITTQAMYSPAPQVPQVNTAGQMGSLASQLYGMGQMGAFGPHKEGGSVKTPRIKKGAFGLSSLKFKSHNKPQKHSSIKFSKMKIGRI